MIGGAPALREDGSNLAAQARPGAAGVGCQTVTGITLSSRTRDRATAPRSTSRSSTGSRSRRASRSTACLARSGDPASRPSASSRIASPVGDASRAVSRERAVVPVRGDPPGDGQVQQQRPADRAFQRRAGHHRAAVGRVQQHRARDPRRSSPSAWPRSSSSSGSGVSPILPALVRGKRAPDGRIRSGVTCVAVGDVPRADFDQGRGAE